MFLVRRAQWPVVLAAIALAECLIELYFGEPFPQILGHVLANWLVPVVGATVVLRWCKGRPDLPRRRDLTAFLVGACSIGPLAGGMLGGWATSWDGEATWLANALYWAFGDALGVLVVATPILLWRDQFHIRGPTGGDRRRSGRHRCAVGHRLLPRAPPAMLILPVLAWAAFRLNMIGAALAGVVIATLVNLMTRYDSASSSTSTSRCRPDWHSPSCSSP